MATTNKQNIKKVGYSYFEIPTKDVLKLHNLISAINLELKGKPTLKLFTEMVSLLKPSYSEDNLKDLVIEQSIINDVVKYLKKHKVYYFTDNTVINKAMKKGIKIDTNFLLEQTVTLDEKVCLDEMVRVGVRAVLSALEEDDKISQGRLIAVCFKALKKYKTANFEEKLYKSYKDYRLNVITGVIIIRIKPKFLDTKKVELVLENSTSSPSEIKGRLAHFVRKELKR